MPKSSGTLPVEPIPFVRPARNTIEDKPERNTRPRPKDDGKEIRSFYESLVGMGESQINRDSQETQSSTHLKKETTQRQWRKPRIKRETVSESSTHPNSEDYFKLMNRLLRSSQEGNLEEIDKVLEQGADINAQDQYGWTALMCAAHSGYAAAVRCLLDSGAYALMRNARNHTAWDVACIAGNSKVVHLLENYSNIIAQEEEVRGNNESKPVFTCEICKTEVQGVSREKHQCSTVHQLNSGRQVNSTSYMIPQSNRGFQLMLKSGWDQDKGLGPEGDGQKYPVKTHLKRDRKGFGGSIKQKCRVTHFDPGDKKAVEGRRPREVTLNKRQASRKERRQKQIEKEFRMSFALE